MMTPLEALQLALSKEIEAAKIYEQFSVKNPLIKRSGKSVYKKKRPVV